MLPQVWSLNCCLRYRQIGLAIFSTCITQHRGQYLYSKDLSHRILKFEKSNHLDFISP